MGNIAARRLLCLPVCRTRTFRGVPFVFSFGLWYTVSITDFWNSPGGPSYAPILHLIKTRPAARPSRRRLPDSGRRLPAGRGHLVGRADSFRRGPVRGAFPADHRPGAAVYRIPHGAVRHGEGRGKPAFHLEQRAGDELCRAVRVLSGQPVHRPYPAFPPRAPARSGCAHYLPQACRGRADHVRFPWPGGRGARGGQSGFFRHVCAFRLFRRLFLQPDVV